MFKEVRMSTVAVADPPAAIKTLGGDTDGTKPGEETVTESATVPENPFRLVRVRVTEPEVVRRIGRV